jgi:hypothetical protein
MATAMATATARWAMARRNMTTTTTTMARGNDDDKVDDEQQLIIFVLFWHILCLSVRFMLISAFYADQANYKNRAFDAYHQVNAVLCLSARLMLISRTIWHV